MALSGKNAGKKIYLKGFDMSGQQLSWVGNTPGLRKGFDLSHCYLAGFTWPRASQYMAPLSLQGAVFADREKLNDEAPSDMAAEEFEVLLAAEEEKAREDLDFNIRKLLRGEAVVLQSAPKEAAESIVGSPLSSVLEAEDMGRIEAAQSFALYR